MTAERPRVAIFTICSNNYMPFAHVLFESARRHHPDAALYLCLADELVAVDGYYGDACTVVQAKDLPIRDFASFAFRYDIMEFNTALKPFMFLHLLEECGFDAVIYLDPDIEIFAPLAPVLEALQAGASFFFTPHLCSPCEERQEPNDIAIMRAGAYNLGFLGVSATEETRRLLAWWARRLRYQCVNAQADGIFVDQKFMDLVPGFAPNACISHDTALNVAYWNLQQRQLDRTANGWTVDGHRLIFFHFSGFNPREPGRLSKHDPRFTSALPEPLRQITARYAAQLLGHGHGAFPSPLYAYGHFASGTPIPAIVRQMFREEHPFWEADPFDSYEAFLHQPWPGAARRPHAVVTNFLHFLHQATPHLRNRFDLQDPAQVDGLVRWFATDALHELRLDPALVAPVADRLGHRRPLPGRIRANRAGEEMTLAVTAPLQSAGEAGCVGRDIFHMALHRGLAVEARDDAAAASRGDAPVQLLCLPIESLETSLPTLAAQLSDETYRILLPLGDRDRFPDAALACLDQVHEVWTPSACLQLSLAGRTDRPVLHMPVPIGAAPVAPLPRAGIGVAEAAFVVVAPIDPTANPDDAAGLAIQAFRQAFPPGGEQCLILVGMGDGLTPDRRTALATRIADDPRVFVLEQPLAAGLLASCDAVLALGCGEGLARVLAQSMLLHKPVIATRYGVALDSVTTQTGYPVDYQSVRAVGDAGRSGWPGIKPDVAHAAWMMRRLADDPQQAAPRLTQAHQLIQQHHAPDRVLARYRTRLRACGAGPT